LAVGDLCMVYGFSGDVMIARKRAQEAKKPYEVNYFIPKGGAPAWFDLMVIPKDAPHPEEALAFINYLLEPQVIAKVSTTVGYANANPDAQAYMDKALVQNPEVYPPQHVLDKLYIS
ncbi:extracellular solute-binding protein, partial [Burkholderia sp. SIMBA_019]|uniref:extracellular solute-binding protein n=1 Tax=Burkholderia sp. SIMBA_019 TaxID=3085765 RepID=UPI00397E613B